ncbi:DGQHR domain-containing protein DpdB [Magnetococcales bacterium HHB-1]
MNKKMHFQAIRARQSQEHDVLTFAASANAINKIAVLDRIRRGDGGCLRGFQRPQISNHIQEIQDYLKRPDAVLPNAIVLAFTEGVRVRSVKDAIVELEVDIDNGPPGLVVDGQQRLSALAELPEKDFQVFVSVILCKTEEELRRQFILINNTKPLPKPLIYELLPWVNDLPKRLSSRMQAARITELLNYDENSSLNGQIKQHTNPDGVITDTAIQKMIMNSLSDGVCRELIRLPDGEKQCLKMVSNYFAAIQEVFEASWLNQTPRTSRLVHGAGIVAMGYVMEHLILQDNATRKETFIPGLEYLKRVTAWTAPDGNWQFGGEVRPWNSLQNIPRDIQLLASFLLRTLKQRT